MSTYDRSSIPDLSEIGGYWDPNPPGHHGGAYVAPGRLVARIPGRQWPHTPEQCTAGATDSEWVLDGRVLLCTGCGIDGT
ncbi:hypothetical protein [Mycolicibacterium sp.]|uniref:hypothetical protein n=1 Tax=Mycolicibacterium sp. TaxID=2320850 RepID=UPI00355D67BE